MRCLMDLLGSAGRPLRDVKRTNAVFLGCWQTTAERDQIVNDVPDDIITFFGGKDAYVSFLQQNITETSPSRVVTQLKAFEDAGCEELIIHYSGMKGDTQLDLIAEHILPHFKS